MLNRIRDMLQSLDHGPVFYGAVPESIELESWNYVVFSRVSDNFSDNRKCGTSYYMIGIISEDYVPEELVNSVVSKIENTAGIKISKDPIQYDYVRKPSTSTVVEVAYIKIAAPGRCFA